MPTVRVTPYQQQPVEITAPTGTSLMQAVVSSGLSGIVAECGGAGMCATCHVYINAAWIGRIAPPKAHELEMLECTAADRRSNSRLSCQILLADELDGMSVLLPSCQQ